VVHHVKLHGALYHMASRDKALAMEVALAIQTTGDLLIYAPWGSELAKAAGIIALAVAHEAFADRTYQSDGSLTPRTQPNALITDANVAVAQVLRMVREGKVRATDGSDVTIKADTVCLHGDGPQAVTLARRLSAALQSAGVECRRAGE
jgi:5-oxoprolinase (ATP-hydrolysing) subunit A